MTALNLRIFRSPQANYYHRDVLRAPEVYTEAWLEQLRDAGFNAIWIRAVLRDTVRTSVYPELAGEQVDEAQAALNCVVRRAAPFGIKVFVYLNEPLALAVDHPFWEAHPEAAGAIDTSSMDGLGESRAFCTSDPDVKRFITESMSTLFSAVPGLGGWFAITASEHHTHCFSHRWGGPDGELPGCPRCDPRQPGDVVAELLTLLRDGTRAASADAVCIAWNWSWAMCIEHDPQPHILPNIPKDIHLLIDWERGGYRTMADGRQNFVDEYSLGYIGPSERFTQTRQAALDQGLPIMAKLQVGTTHELGTVPNLPLIGNLYEKLRRIEARELKGILASWNFGNEFSLNTAAIERFMRTTDRPEPDDFVRDLLAERFPSCDAAGGARAIADFTAAMQHYPFDIPVIYYGPVNYALAYPLSLKPLTGKEMGVSCFNPERGDDLSQSAVQFTIEEIADGYDRLGSAWSRTVHDYERAMAPAGQAAMREVRVAKVAGCAFRSAANVYRTYILRRDRPADMQQRFAHLVAREIAILEEALPAVEADARLGYHGEAHAYLFNAPMIKAKLANLHGHRHAG